MRRHDDAIVHPPALAARRDDSSAAQVGEMARNFRLWTAEYLDEVAHAKFLVAHKVQESEAGVVSESLEETFHIEVPFCGHRFNIYALTYL